MEHDDSKITITVIGVMATIACIVLIVVTLESGRKTDLLSAQIREMRQSMEDAGYVPREPKIGVER